jgi:hypothetical protein
MIVSARKKRERERERESERERERERKRRRAGWLVRASSYYLYRAT